MNEAANLPKALASVPTGAAALVVDSQSHDRTVEIARAHGANVVVRPWAGYGATRTFALGLVETPWTFMLDADERLDGELAAAVTNADGAGAFDAYTIARTTYFCGRGMSFGAWGGESLVRFFRTAKATIVTEPAVGGTADLHERWVVAGSVGALPGKLVHDSYPTLRSYREKFARYTSLEARGLPPSRGRLAAAFVKAWVRVLWSILGRQAWRDGWRGIFVALASAAYPVVVAWKALRA